MGGNSCRGSSPLPGTDATTTYPTAFGGGPVEAAAARPWQNSIWAPTYWCAPPIISMRPRARAAQPLDAGSARAAVNDCRHQRLRRRRMDNGPAQTHACPGSGLLTKSAPVRTQGCRGGRPRQHRARVPGQNQRLLCNAASRGCVCWYHRDSRLSGDHSRQGPMVRFNRRLRRGRTKGACCHGGSSLKLHHRSMRTQHPVGHCVRGRGLWDARWATVPTLSSERRRRTLRQAPVSADVVAHSGE